MFERFTEQAIKVIMLAQEESRRMGHNFVGTEQILLGIMRETRGSAFTTLKAAGMTLEGLRSEVEKIIGRGSGFVAVEIPFTPRAKRALELSWESARDLGVNYIDTEHLLMGLLGDREGVAARVLAMHLDIDELRKALVADVAKTVPARFFRIGLRPAVDDVSRLVRILTDAKQTLGNMHTALDKIKADREIVLDDVVRTGLLRLDGDLQKLDELLKQDWSDVRKNISVVQSDIKTVIEST